MYALIGEVSPPIQNLSIYHNIGHALNWYIYFRHSDDLDVRLKDQEWIKKQEESNEKINNLLAIKEDIEKVYKFNKYANISFNWICSFLKTILMHFIWITYSFIFLGHRISEEQEDTWNGAADWNKNCKGKFHEWAWKSSRRCV